MYKVFIYYVLISVTLSACASSGDTGRSSDDPGPDLDFRGSHCILIRTIRDYTPLDSQHLLIRGAGRRAYFVTLQWPATDMRGSIGFSVSSRDDQLCPYGGDNLVFGSFGDNRVPVRSISRLTEEQEEQVLIRYGLQDLDESATPVDPENVKGAEVEELG